MLYLFKFKKKMFGNRYKLKKLPNYKKMTNKVNIK